MEPSDSSNNSELEFSSDSDWLDISSSKESEDNDSFDEDGRPLSRRSFNSHISSIDENEIVAWTGYDGEEDGLDIPFAPILPRLSDSPEVNPATRPPEGNAVEDQLVKEALDQSMMSTLSASRSSSFGRSSIQTVPPELRLSFPDPISSSRNTLTRSYEIADFSDITLPPSSDDNHAVQELTIVSEDPGSLTMPEVPSDTDPSVTESPSSSPCDLDIVLYGFSAGSKWEFVDYLLDQLSLATGRRPSKSVILSSFRRERELCSQEDIHDIRCRLIAVTDKTESDPSLDFPFDRPSLGIVFLPSSIGTLSSHNRYLPLIPPSAYTNDSPGAKETVRNTVQDKWQKFEIPSKQLLLNEPGKPPVMEIEELHRIDSKRLALAFESLLPGILPRVKQESVIGFKLPAQLNSPWVLQIFFALTCALIGCVMTKAPSSAQLSGASVTPAPPPSSSASLWSAERLLNQTASLAVGPTPTDMFSIVPVSLKDFALTVFNPPGSLSVVESKSPLTPQPSTSGSGPSESSTRGIDTVRSDKEIVPFTFTRERALSIMSSTEKGKGRETIEDVLYEICIQMSRSLTDMLDMEFIQAIAESLGREVKEILTFFEELVEELKAQGAMVWENRMNTVQEIRKHLKEKHEIAKRNAKKTAKDWTEFGERMLEYATDTLNDHRVLARDSAMAINKRVFKSEEWLMHEKEKDARCKQSLPVYV